MNKVLLSAFIVIAMGTSVSADTIQYCYNCKVYPQRRVVRKVQRVVQQPVQQPVQQAPVQQVQQQPVQQMPMQMQQPVQQMPMQQPPIVNNETVIVNPQPQYRVIEQYTEVPVPVPVPVPVAPICVWYPDYYTFMGEIFGYDYYQVCR